MKRPPIFPPPQFPPVKLRMFQRMPPAVFPVIMGLFGLGLALRKGALAIGYPVEIAEFVLGAVSLLWVFAATGYLAKAGQRAAVVMEDLANLPGRTGLSAATLGLSLLSLTVLPYSTTVATLMLFAGLAVHAGLVFLIIRSLLLLPPEGRGVSPPWHLHFVGFIIPALAAATLGFGTLALVLFMATALIAATLWAIAVFQLIQRVPPAPLRPLLAIHLAPACLLGSVAYMLEMRSVAVGFALLGAAILVAMIISARWITESGFSALWGAFTFPLAAYATLLLTLGGVWVWGGVIVLTAAIGIVPAISIKVIQAWTKGTLAAKTNAATA